MTPEQEAKLRESVRLLAGTENLQWANNVMATLLAELDAARAERDRLTAALLAIFDLTADRPNVREIARAALTKEGWT